MSCNRESPRPAVKAPRPVAATQASAADEDLRLVQTVVAELLKCKPQDVAPHKTFAQLRADELDLVEAVMEVEDRLTISISDEAIFRAAGTSSMDEVLSRLTIARFAQAVSAIRQELPGVPQSQRNSERKRS
jgi:acyl carrier protein